MPVGRWYKSLKSRLNTLLERALPLCNHVLEGYYRLPRFLPEKALQALVHFIGDLIWLIVNFPRIPAYRIDHDGATIIFVGNEGGLKWFRLSFYEKPPAADVVQDAGRIALWKLNQQCDEWLAGDIDLVVCELGRRFPWRLQAPLTFSVPTGVTQVLNIPASLDSLFTGKKYVSLRNRLHKASKEGFSYSISQSDADFDFFHHTLLEPYIRDQHGELAVIESYDDHYRLFKRGGLIMVMYNGEKVGGQLGFFSDDTYMHVETGFLHRDERLKKYGVNAFITWSGLQWAKQNGAVVYDLGISNAWRSDGVFAFKRRLGMKVIRPKMIDRQWVFLADELSDPIREYLNKMGFISEVQGKFYGVHLHLESAPLTGENLQHIREDWADEGVDGIVIVSRQPALIYPTITE